MSQGTRTPTNLGVFVVGFALLLSPWKNHRHQVDGFAIPRSFQPTLPRVVTKRAKCVYTSQRPLEEILLELEARGIQFRSTATKSELESLLVLSKGISMPRPDGEILSSNDDTGRQSDRRSTQRRRTRSKWPEIDYQYYYSDDGGSLNERDVRRRRRQRRREQGRSSVSASDALFRFVDKTSRTVARVVPEKVVDMGSKATSIASRKTQQLFNELVDLTYEDLDAPKRRVRRPSSKGDHNSSFAENSRVPPRRLPRKEETKSDRIQVDIDPSPSYETRDERKMKRRTNRPKANSTPEGKTTTTTTATTTTIAPIREILSELDSMNIFFSPQATRQELEDLLDRAKRSKENSSPAAGTESASTFSELEGISGSVDGPNFEAPTTSDKSSFSGDVPLKEQGIWSRTSRVASKNVKAMPRKVSDTVRNKARRTYRKAYGGVSGLFQHQGADENPSGTTPIIVDAVVEDFSKTSWSDDVIDVKPIYRESWSTTRQGTDTRSRPRSGGPEHSHPSTKSRATRDRLRSKRLRPGPTTETLNDSQSERQVVASAGIPRLAPAKDYSEPGTRRRTVTGRRIYSPYSRNDGDDTFVYEDGLDQFGDFVASSLDSFLWGPEDQTSPNPASSSSDRRKPTSAAGRRQRSGNWKDRMEEQFDYLLGIHQDSQYYNRWVNQEREDERNVEGTDAVSYARGRAPQPGRKRRISERPIWEEEDSLLSMLFGTDKQAQHRDDMFYRPMSFLGSGSLIKILQTLLRSSSLLAGGVCRWASVRGSLPQPVVVVGAVSAVLSSRPGSRLRNLVLTLLVIRAAGELLHGYMYDDTDFWEPEDGQNNEQVPEKG